MEDAKNGVGVPTPRKPQPTQSERAWFVRNSKRRGYIKRAYAWPGVVWVLEVGHGDGRSRRHLFYRSPAYRGKCRNPRLFEVEKAPSKSCRFHDSGRHIGSTDMVGDACNAYRRHSFPETSAKHSGAW